MLHLEDGKRPVGAQDSTGKLLDEMAAVTLPLLQDVIYAALRKDTIMVARYCNISSML